MKRFLIFVYLLNIFNKLMTTTTYSDPVTLVNITWTDNIDSTDFVMTINSLNNSCYFAFGLSKDNGMGDDDVAVCGWYPNGTIGLVHNYNNDTFDWSSFMLNTNLQIGFSNIINTNQNGQVTCSFRRAKLVQNVQNYFNISSQAYYILTAIGPIDNSGVVSQHFNQNPSTNSYSFTNSSFNQSTQQDGQQGFKISWKNNFDSTDFNVSYTIVSASASSTSRKRRQTSQAAYFAYGLSTDTSMGNDDVVVCIILSDGSTNVIRNYNSGTLSSLMSSTNPSIGLTNIFSSYSNGVLTCSFTRTKVVTGLTNNFDLSNQYYILTAVGTPSSAIAIKRHATAVSSSQTFNFLTDGSYSNTLTGNNGGAKAKAHGCLMVFAWLFIASTGILFARYYKDILPQVKWMNVQFWFFIHRPFMISVPIISFVSFLIILSSLNWKWVSNDGSIEFSHSIIGILTISFSFIQVFLAFFRCDKDHPKRFIFNYIHRTFGILTFLLAVVCIYLGVCLSGMSLGKSGWGIMIGWTLWIFIIIILLEGIEIKYSNKTNGIEMKGNKVDGLRKDQENIGLKNGNLKKNIRSYAFLVHLVTAFGFTLALIIVIGVAQISFN